MAVDNWLHDALRHALLTGSGSRFRPVWLALLVAALVGSAWWRGVDADRLRADQAKLDGDAASLGFTLVADWRAPLALWPTLTASAVVLRLADKEVMRTGPATIRRRFGSGTAPTLSLAGPVTLDLAALIGPSPEIRFWGERFVLRWNVADGSAAVAAPWQVALAGAGPDHAFTSSSARVDTVCGADGPSLRALILHRGSTAIIMAIRPPRPAERAWRFDVRWHGTEAFVVAAPNADPATVSVRLGGRWRSVLHALSAMGVVSEAEERTAIGMVGFLASAEPADRGETVVPVRLDTGTLRVGNLLLVGPGALTVARVRTAADELASALGARCGRIASPA